MLLRLFRRRRALSAVKELSHKDAARMLRSLAYENVNDNSLMLMLAERALDSAPEEHRANMQRWVAALQGGHRIKVGTYRVAFLEPVDPYLAHAVDEVFNEMNEGDDA